MKLFCKHDWQLISEVTTKSKMELFNECGGTKLKGVPFDFMDRKLIQIVTCTKCGKLKRYIEEV